MGLMRNALCEFLGTLVLVFFGVSTIAMVQLKLPLAGAPVPTMAIPLAFAGALAMSALTFGTVSPGHFNPSITLAAILGRTVSLKAGVTYIFVQFLGALTAVCVVWMIFDARVVTEASLGAALPNPLMRAGGIILWETLLTCFLVIAALLPSQNPLVPKTITGLVTGLAVTATLFLGVLTGGPMTGGSLNPARTVAPLLGLMLAEVRYPQAPPETLLGQTFSPPILLTYLVAGILGSLLAWMILKLVKPA
jgi:aquaporin Z